MIELLTQLLKLLPEWLVIAFLIAELATIIQALYWWLNGHQTCSRPLALVSLGASTSGFILFYIVVVFASGSVPVSSLAALSRILIIAQAIGTTHLLSDYWRLTYRKATQWTL